jgi:hypothetical protein
MKKVKGRDAWSVTGSFENHVLTDESEASVANYLDDNNVEDDKDEEDDEEYDDEDYDDSIFHNDTSSFSGVNSYGSINSYDSSTAKEKENIPTTVVTKKKGRLLLTDVTNNKPKNKKKGTVKCLNCFIILLFILTMSLVIPKIKSVVRKKSLIVRKKKKIKPVRETNEIISVNRPPLPGLSFMAWLNFGDNGSYSLSNSDWLRVRGWVSFINENKDFAAEAVTFHRLVVTMKKDCSTPSQ